MIEIKEDKNGKLTKDSRKFLKKQLKKWKRWKKETGDIPVENIEKTHEDLIELLELEKED